MEEEHFDGKYTRILRDRNNAPCLHILCYLSTAMGPPGMTQRLDGPDGLLA